MNFLFTNYIYPIKEPFLLSKNLNFYLDNPRTDEEIEVVTEYIRQAYTIESAFQYSENIIRQWLSEFLSEYSQEDEYINEFHKAYSQLQVYELLARIWIVARYDNEGEYERLQEYLQQERKKLAEKGGHGFFMLEDDHPMITKPKQLIEYSYLISLLLHTDEFYEGNSFILNHDEREFENICLQIHTFMHAIKRIKVTTMDVGWLFFPLIKEQLIVVRELIDDVLSKNLKEKLLYITVLLKVAGYDIKDNKTQLVILVSIIELLVTHNPDFNRFNIEDSINKQFQLKAATLIYLNDKSKDINQIKRRLKEIYGLRSSIAHGDFKAVTKYLETAKKKGEEFTIDAIITDLYSYLRAIITEYLRDDKFVDFLKDG